MDPVVLPKSVEKRPYGKSTAGARQTALIAVWLAENSYRGIEIYTGMAVALGRHRW